MIAQNSYIFFKTICFKKNIFSFHRAIREKAAHALGDYKKNPSGETCFIAKSPKDFIKKIRSRLLQVGPLQEAGVSSGRDPALAGVLRRVPKILAAARIGVPRVDGGPGGQQEPTGGPGTRPQSAPSWNSELMSAAKLLFWHFSCGNLLCKFSRFSIKFQQKAFFKSWKIGRDNFVCCLAWRSKSTVVVGTEIRWLSSSYFCILMALFIGLLLSEHPVHACIILQVSNMLFCPPSASPTYSSFLLSFLIWKLCIYV